MYVFKENDLTKDQYVAFKPSRTRMETAVRSMSFNGDPANPDKNFLIFCANTHEYIFGRPRPNIKSGAVILTMFKNLLRKISEYEAINYASEPTTEATAAESVRRIIRKAEDRRGRRR